MRVNKSFFKLMIASFVLAAMPVIAAAQTETRRNVNLMSSLLNFTKGQAVSLNFTNVDRVPREVKAYILDANNVTLKSATWQVVPGQSVSLNFTFGELGRTSQQRVGIRGVVTLVEPPEPDATPPQPDFSLANLDVYDVATGKTTFGLLLPAVRNLNVLFPTDQ